MNVKDKVIAVTGAAGGLGAGIARTLCANGAEVWLLDLDAAYVSLAEELCSNGGKAHGLHLDVTSPEEWQSVLTTIAGCCGRIGHMYTPEAYTATKGAITMFTKAVASRYGKEGIRCNSIHPSTVMTALVAKMMEDPERRRERYSEVPLGRLASVDDVANSVLYLASDEASFINGVSLPVDGGVTCY